MSTAAAFAPARRTGLPEMRLLSVRQPWAWQILHEHKDVENRIIPTSGYRGWVAIHAARTPDEEALSLLPGVPPQWVDAEHASSSMRPSSESSGSSTSTTRPGVVRTSTAARWRCARRGR